MQRRPQYDYGLPDEVICARLQAALQEAHVPIEVSVDPEFGVVTHRSFDSFFEEEVWRAWDCIGVKPMCYACWRHVSEDRFSCLADRPHTDDCGKVRP